MSDAVTVALIAAGASFLTAALQVLSHRRQGRIEGKVKETHHQVAVNNHSSASPTLLDKMDDLTGEVRAVKAWADRHELQHDVERQYRNP